MGNDKQWLEDYDAACAELGVTPEVRSFSGGVVIGLSAVAYTTTDGDMNEKFETVFTTMPNGSVAVGSRRQQVTPTEKEKGVIKLLGE